MSFLKSLFGPSRKEIWQKLSGEVGGRFHEGDLFTPTAVQVRADDWIITLDTFTVSTGQSSQTYTRLRAPYFNPEGFRFEIYRASLFSELGKGLGMQDIEVGHPRFDEDFVIKGNAPGRVRRFFDNEEIRRLIAAQPKIRLSVKAHEGWLSKFPAGVDELHFQSTGVIKDLARLRTLFDLFAEVLQELCHEGEAYEDDVEIHIRRLSAPGGEIKDKYLLWEGDGPRRDAAAALGRLGNPAAVPALSAVLRDEDALLRARAIEALAAIGHTDAIGPLIPLLGDTRDADGEPVQERVAAALRQLGAGARVDVVLAALRGDFGPLKVDDRAYRAQMVAALEGALEGPSGTHAASALAGTHAVEALPRLREVLRRIGSQEAAGPAVAAAIRRLEARAALPRAASAARVGLDTLPRSARAPSPDSRTLPRGSRAPSEEDRANRIDRTPRED